jgi:hypothetical protein
VLLAAGFFVEAAGVTAAADFFGAVFLLAMVFPM